VEAETKNGKSPSTPSMPADIVDLVHRLLFTSFLLLVLAVSQFHSLEHGLSALVHAHHESESPAHHDESGNSDEELIAGINAAPVRYSAEIAPTTSVLLVMIPIVADHRRLVSSSSGSPPAYSPPFYIAHHSLLI